MVLSRIHSNLFTRIIFEIIICWHDQNFSVWIKGISEILLRSQRIWKFIGQAAQKMVYT
jgi:hypothetical protein